MEKYKNINEKNRPGYEYESKNGITKACDIWLDAWEGIRVKSEVKSMFPICSSETLKVIGSWESQCIRQDNLGTSPFVSKTPLPRILHDIYQVCY
ncbi:MAG: hypothetical protein ACOCG5_11395 [Candidatus Alkaliphilus sp. MAG34]|nr:hypothetical protein [Clostridiales bacterium]